MYPSSALCRAQEAHHLGRAATAPLDNVRAIATKAALAWGEEALSAERREARHGQTKRVAALAALDKSETRAQRDRLFSENPDRGFESP
jgi:hypothetical protein